MTVQELQAILANAAPDALVVIDDADTDFKLHVTDAGISEADGVVHLAGDYGSQYTPG